MAKTFRSDFIIRFDEEYAKKINDATEAVLKEGKIVTPDLGGQSTTMEMTKEITRKILEGDN